MGMYTWLNEYEFDLYSKVSDKELNEVFQEVRELMPLIYISERTHTESGLFKKTKVLTSYTIYHRTNGRYTEVRVMNINTSNKAYVFNYLCGLLNGYNFKNK